MATQKRRHLNPFMIFCKELQKTVPCLKTEPLKKVVDYCSPLWENMSLDERLPYKKKARGARYYSEDSVPVTRTPISKEAEDALVKQCFVNIMESDLTRLVRGRASDDELRNQRFHIMTVNTWLTRDKYSIPAEIALVEFSLESGVTNRWSEIFDPISIPFGHAATVNDNIEKVHHIQPSGSHLSLTHPKVFQKLAEILTATEGERHAGQDICLPEFKDVPVPPEIVSASKHKLLPIFVFPEHLEEVAKVLHFMAKCLGRMDILFPLYNLSILTALLLNYSHAQLEPYAVVSITEHLRKEFYFHESSLRCSYHTEIDSYKCALTKASGFAFSVCDLCCPAYRVRPVDGLHTLLNPLERRRMFKSFERQLKFDLMFKSILEFPVPSVRSADHILQDCLEDASDTQSFISGCSSSILDIYFSSPLEEFPDDLRSESAVSFHSLGTSKNSHLEAVEDLNFTMQRLSTC